MWHIEWHMNTHDIDGTGNLRLLAVLKLIVIISWDDTCIKNEIFFFFKFVQLSLIVPILNHCKSKRWMELNICDHGIANILK